MALPTSVSIRAQNRLAENNRFEILQKNDVLIVNPRQTIIVNNIRKQSDQIALKGETIKNPSTQLANRNLFQRKAMSLDNSTQLQTRPKKFANQSKGLSKVASIPLISGTEKAAIEVQPAIPKIYESSSVRSRLETDRRASSHLANYPENNPVTFQNIQVKPLVLEIHRHKIGNQQAPISKELHEQVDLDAIKSVLSGDRKQKSRQHEGMMQPLKDNQRQAEQFHHLDSSITHHMADFLYQSASSRDMFSSTRAYGLDRWHKNELELEQSKMMWRQKQRAIKMGGIGSALIDRDDRDLFHILRSPKNSDKPEQIKVVQPAKIETKADQKQEKKQVIKLKKQPLA